MTRQAVRVVGRPWGTLADGINIPGVTQKYQVFKKIYQVYWRLKYIPVV